MGMLGVKCPGEELGVKCPGEVLGLNVLGA